MTIKDFITEHGMKQGTKDSRYIEIGTEVERAVLVTVEQLARDVVVTIAVPHCGTASDKRNAIRALLTNLV